MAPRDDDRVGRGGLKLQAAIERFGLAARIRGARAVDVGASTGGFTETMLRHGAVHVTAIDVGRGQLHSSLASDPRVESIEGVHWKTLALSQAPGPFDFFTVDVSFIAARSMLRGLAFRLRPGAEGFVLIKPQFEVADKRVRGGDVSDPNLRRDAVESVRKKGESLGFRVLATADSPVAGGSGTIEILAHLVFDGRSEKLPQPGESRGQKGVPARGAEARGHAPNDNDDDDAPAKARGPGEPATARGEAGTKGERAGKGPRSARGGAGKTPGAWSLFAVAAPGIEPVLLREVAALPGVRDARIVPGGVEFAGAIELVQRANLWLRTATRLLVRVGGLVEAREFAKLRHRAAALPWEQFLDASQPIAISASQSGCRLYHTGAIAENLAAAIGDRLGAPVSIDAAGAKVLARGSGDQWTFSVDTSGELLHRRGWREETAHAPMRETLAAALLALCEWDGATPFVDPMCGAGTLPVEACGLAMRWAPGLARTFAFERWPANDAARLAALRAEAEATRLAAPPAPILGSDRSPAAVAAAGRNAERAGMASFVTLTRAELGDVKPPATPGLVLLNPPYGRRLGDPRTLRRLYGEIGRALRMRFAGWQAGVLLADPRLVDALGARVLATHPLSNGGIRVTLVRLDLGPATRRG